MKDKNNKNKQTNKSDCVLDHKTSLNKFQRGGIIQLIFSVNNASQYEINNKTILKIQNHIHLNILKYLFLNNFKSKRNNYEDENRLRTQW